MTKLGQLWEEERQQALVEAAEAKAEVAKVKAEIAEAKAAKVTVDTERPFSGDGTAVQYVPVYDGYSESGRNNMAYPQNGEHPYGASRHLPLKGEAFASLAPFSRGGCRRKAAGGCSLMRILLQKLDTDKNRNRALRGKRTVL